jgi:hypothetical protein
MVKPSSQRRKKRKATIALLAQSRISRAITNSCVARDNERARIAGVFVSRDASAILLRQHAP